MNIRRVTQWSSFFPYFIRFVTSGIDAIDALPHIFFFHEFRGNEKKMKYYEEREKKTKILTRLITFQEI